MMPLRPVAAQFLYELGRGFAKAFPGEKLKIVSAGRTNRNFAGSPLSAHRRGLAFDIGDWHNLNTRKREWLAKTLRRAEAAGRIDGIRERIPPHWHITVFPRRAGRYLALDVKADPNRSQIAVSATNGKSVIFYETKNPNELRYFKSGKAIVLSFSDEGDMLTQVGKVLNSQIGAKRERVPYEFKQAYNSIIGRVQETNQVNVALRVKTNRQNTQMSISNKQGRGVILYRRSGGNSVNIQIPERGIKQLDFKHANDLAVQLGEVLNEVFGENRDNVRKGFITAFRAMDLKGSAR